jgi:Flp pilus assembly pilin Flp
MELGEGMGHREKRGDSLREQGASLPEYAFLVALIAIVVILGVVQLGTQISDWYSGYNTPTASMPGGEDGGGGGGGGDGDGGGGGGEIILPTTTTTLP